MSDFDVKAYTEDLVKKQNRSGDDWAIAFRATILEQDGLRIDQDTARAWFCNAMMSMHDSIHNNEIKELQKENQLLKDAIKAELKRCGGTIPILSKVLREVES